jgi:hypothetical protein
MLNKQLPTDNKGWPSSLGVGRGVNQVAKDEMGWPFSTNGEKRNAYRLLVIKPEGKRPLGRPRRRWVDNIRMYLGEVGWGDVDWIGLAQNRNRWRALVNSVLNLRVP